MPFLTGNAMELRWMIKKNLGITAQAVQMYAERHMCSMADAKRRLVKDTPPVLQYRQGMGYEWQDVPTEVIPYPTTTPSTFSNRD